MYDDAKIPEPVIPDWLDTDACPVTLYNHHWAFNPGPMQDWEVRKARAVYYGMITNIDHQLGRLFGRLMREGLWENTVVVYTTDHGEQLGDYHDAHKYSFFEGPARIPMIWRFPRRYGLTSGRISPHLVELADLLPTFCDLMGAETPPDVTGRSLMPLLEGVEGHPWRETLHAQIDTQHMFHTGTYKYLYFCEDGRELLFDMEASRRDEVNLAGDEALVAPIRERFVAHLREEGNDHLVHGALFNMHKEREPLNELRAQNPLGWGAAGR
jgi:arylsulfatase A-like enzyme